MSLAPGQTPTETAARNQRRKWLNDYSMPIAYAVLFVVLTFTVENFFSAANIVGLMLSVAQVGMKACTMMMCLASRDFDLSVGSTIAFAGVLGAMILEATGSVLLAIGGGLAFGLIIGQRSAALPDSALAELKLKAMASHGSDTFAIGPKT